MLMGILERRHEGGVDRTLVGVQDAQLEQGAAQDVGRDVDDEARGWILILVGRWIDGGCWRVRSYRMMGGIEDGRWTLDVGRR